MVKTLKNLLWNQKADDLESWYVKGFLFNVGSQRKPVSLFPVEPMAAILVIYLPSTQSRLVLLETVLN